MTVISSGRSGRFCSTRTAPPWSCFCLVYFSNYFYLLGKSAGDLSVSLCVCASVCVSIDRIGHILMKIKSVEMTFVDVITKIVLSDPELLSEDQKLKNLYILYDES